MKLSLLNEATDITGKLDPLIAKYEKLKDMADGNESLHYELMINKLKNATTLEVLIDFLNLMKKNLVETQIELAKAKTKLDPDNAFSSGAYERRELSLNRAISTYRDIITYGKSIKLF